MRKLLLSVLVLMTAIISCNNQDQLNETEKTNAGVTSAREKILKDSIAKFPESVLLKKELIKYYVDSLEDYSKALIIVDDELSKDSLNDNLWDIKGSLHFENGDTLNAIKCYEMAMKAAPQPRYLLLLGSLFAQTKNNKALQVADALIKTKLPETEKEAFFIQGLYFNYTGDKTKAIVALDKCLNLDNRYMFAYREKGIALYDMGKYEDAITVLDKAVTLQNSFDEGYYWLGRCLEKLNKPNDAIEEYKTALMYSTDYVEAKDALARLGVK